MVCQGAICRLVSGLPSECRVTAIGWCLGDDGVCAVSLGRDLVQEWACNPQADVARLGVHQRTGMKGIAEFGGLCLTIVTWAVRDADVVGFVCFCLHPSSKALPGAACQHSTSISLPSFFAVDLSCEWLAAGVLQRHGCQAGPLGRLAWPDIGSTSSMVGTSLACCLSLRSAVNSVIVPWSQFVDEPTG